MSGRAQRRRRHLGVATIVVATIVGLAVPAAAVLPPIAVHLGTTSDAAGTVTLANVACNTASLCVALGENQGGSTWYVVAIHNGVPDAPQLIAGSTSMRDIACSDADNCVAVGDHVVAIVDGVAGAPQTAATTSGVACASATQCWAVGGSTLLSIVGGVVAATSTTTRFTNMHDVSCVSDTTCMVIGDNPYPVTNPIHNDAFSDMSSGVIGKPVVLRGNQDATFENITCAPGKNCFVGGSIFGESSEAVRLGIGVGGKPGQGRIIDETNFNSPEMDSAACPTATRCVFSAFQSIVLATRTGYFSFAGGVNLPNDGTFITALSCPTAASCVAVGEHPDTNNPGSFIGFVQMFSVS